MNENINVFFEREKNLKKSVDLACTFMTMIRMERRKDSRNKEKVNKIVNIENEEKVLTFVSP